MLSRSSTRRLSVVQREGVDFPAGLRNCAALMSTLAGRLKTFLLALINATLILGIIFATCAILLVTKVERFTDNIITDVKFDLLQEIDKDVRQLVGSIRKGEEDLRLITERLDKLTTTPEITLSPQLQNDVRRLHVDIRSLQRSVTLLTLSHVEISDRTIREIAASLANAYITARNCPVSQASKSRFSQ